MQIDGTAAIVTGGASGLGAATAAALADKGATVFAIDLPDAIRKATEKANQQQGNAGNIHFIAADVTNPEQVQTAVRQAVDSGAPLRIAVNCAGVAWASRVLTKNGPHDFDLFSKVVQINLIGTFNVLRLAAEAISKTKPLTDNARGVVINTASVAAYDGQIGQLAYSASKGGVVGMTLPAARDLAKFGIRVMTIAPGIVDTPMMAGITEEFRENLAAGVPFPARLAQPAEYAQLAVNIVEHDYLNGEVIRLDGALRMAPR